MKRKILTLLALVMLLSVLPMAVHAEDNADCEHFVESCVCIHCGETIHLPLWNITEQHRQFCGSCEEVLIPWEDHVDADGNGSCDKCEHVIGSCTHSNIDLRSDDYYHYRYCNDCSTDIGISELHKGSPCIICGAAHNGCIDLNVDNMCDICDKEIQHYCYDGDGDYLCDVCGNMIQHYCCDEDGNCICDDCGKVCHSEVLRSHDTYHEILCGVCGTELESGDHYDSDNDRLCDRCFHLMSGNCAHENVWYAIYPDGHVAYCTFCGEVTTRFTEHTAPCSVCGYSPCSDGSHVFDGHICTVCSVITDCEDTTGDCRCDICGFIWHSGAYTLSSADELQHQWTCDLCGEIAWEGEHYDDLDNDDWTDTPDGLCDECGYVMSGTTTPDPDPAPGPDPDNSSSTPGGNTPTPPASNEGLDRVPKTGDISVPLMAISLTLLCTALLFAQKKRAV